MVGVGEGRRCKLVGMPGQSARRPEEPEAPSALERNRQVWGSFQLLTPTSQTSQLWSHALLK
jgi:hypothetical protein